MTARRLRRLFALSAAAALLAACGGGRDGEGRRLGPVAPGAAASAPTTIAFDLPGFDPAATQQTSNRDVFTGNEVHYAEFSGRDSFAAVVLVTAAPGYVLEPQDGIRHFARALPEAQIVWKERGRVRAGGQGVDYRLFALPEADFDCFAFDGWWRPAADEVLTPSLTQQAFGFYCRAAGPAALQEPEVRRIVRRITFAVGGA